MVNFAKAGTMRTQETKTHCVHGHALTPENTYVTKTGQVQCNECKRLRMQRKRQKDREQAAGTPEQFRARLNEDKVEEYAEKYRQGVGLPSRAVYEIAGELVLAAGFQRLEAARRAGLTEIGVDIRQGTLRDA
jgi:hypothetical protein